MAETKAGVIVPRRRRTRALGRQLRQSLRRLSCQQNDGVRDRDREVKGWLDASLTTPGAESSSLGSTAATKVGTTAPGQQCSCFGLTAVTTVLATERRCQGWRGRGLARRVVDDCHYCTRSGQLERWFDGCDEGREYSTRAAVLLVLSNRTTASGMERSRAGLTCFGSRRSWQQNDGVRDGEVESWLDD